MEQNASVIALGFFDGVHIGHGALLRRTVQRARELNAVPAAITFDARPKKFTTKQNAFLLSSVEERIDLMRRCCGIEKVIVIRVDSGLLHMSWQDFIVKFLIAEHGAVHLVAGHDFRFGYQGEGTPEKLREQCAISGIGCDIISPVSVEHTIVSSTCIRSLIAQGDMDRATELLGHPHTLLAQAQPQNALSALLGAPCVSIDLAPERTAAAPGVYAARLYSGGRMYRAAAYLDELPAAPEGAPLPAVCLLLDPTEAPEGGAVRLELLHRIRARHKYPCREELLSQSARDRHCAGTYFDNSALNALPA